MDKSKLENRSPRLFLIGGLIMEGPIVILDDDGTALGSVSRREDGVFLLDRAGRQLREVSVKSTIKDLKEILLRSKLPMVV